MRKFKTSLLIVVALFGLSIAVFADRGRIGKKQKSKVVLNITVPTNLRSAIPLNLKYGLTYKGSLMTTSSIFNTAPIMTYQKGNTTYIVPFKNKIVTSEVRQGYTGIKLILKPLR